MLSERYYREQADLMLRMALASGDPERSAHFEAHARLFLNLAEHDGERPSDLNALLDGFNQQQLRTAFRQRSPTNSGR
jgi:hypothetical protein